MAWKPAKSTPQYHVARQKENYEAWNGWKNSVIQKGKMITGRSSNVNNDRKRGPLAATVKLRLPVSDAKAFGDGFRDVEIVRPDEFEGFRNRMGFV